MGQKTPPRPAAPWLYIVFGADPIVGAASAQVRLLRNAFREPERQSWELLWELKCLSPEAQNGDFLPPNAISNLEALRVPPGFWLSAASHCICQGKQTLAERVEALEWMVQQQATSSDETGRGFRWFGV